MDKYVESELNNEEEEDNKKKKPILLLFLYSISLLLFILSGSFALSSILKNKSSNYDEIQIGQVQMDLIGNENTNINLKNAYPMTSEEAMNLEPFEFKITNTGTLAVTYRLSLIDVDKNEITEDLPNDKLDEKYVSYSLIDSDTNTVVSTGSISNLENGLLIENKLQPKYSKNYKFRLWVNENAGAESENKYYITKIHLEIDDILK